MKPLMPFGALAGLLGACAPPAPPHPPSIAAAGPPIQAGSPASGAPAVTGPFRPAPQAPGGGPLVPGGWGGDALFGADSPPDAMALGSASADAALPAFGTARLGRPPRFIRDLQF